MEWKFRTKDHLEIYARLRIPEHFLGTVILVVHGIGEHSGRYESMASELNAQGICLASFDQRGHGLSSGPRGHTPSMDAWMEDINYFIRQLKLRVKAERIILLGHSMGGLEVLNYILSQPEGIDGAIVLSPALGLVKAPTGWKRFMAKLANKWSPEKASPTGLNPEDLSHDKAIVKSYISDPLVHDQITARTFATIEAGSEWVMSYAKTLKIPVLLMHGDQDNITSIDASAEFAKLTSKRTEFRIWKGFRHELQHEVDKQQVIDKILEWCHILTTRGRTL